MWIRKSINLMFFPVVLVSAGVELTFFTVAGMWLCFGLVLGTNGHSGDNAGMFLFLLSRARTEPRHFLLFILTLW